MSVVYEIPNENGDFPTTVVYRKTPCVTFVLCVITFKNNIQYSSHYFPPNCSHINIIYYEDYKERTDFSLTHVQTIYFMKTIVHV